MLSRRFRILIKPRCCRYGKRHPWVPGWCLCQSCNDEQQQCPPAIAVAS